MTWQQPIAARSTGELITASIWNTDIGDQFSAIPGKQTIWVPAAAMRPTVSNGCDAAIDVETTSGRPDVGGAEFSGSVDQFAQFQIALPKQWNKSTVTYQVWWSGRSAGAGAVVWQLQGVVASDDDTFDVAYGTAIKVTDTFLALEDVHVAAESAAVTIAGTPVNDDLCSFRVGRMANSEAGDTKIEKVMLLGIKLFVTTNSPTDA